MLPSQQGTSSTGEPSVVCDQALHRELRPGNFLKFTLMCLPQNTKYKAQNAIVSSGQQSAGGLLELAHARASMYRASDPRAPPGRGCRDCWAQVSNARGNLGKSECLEKNQECSSIMNVGGLTLDIQHELHVLILRIILDQWLV